mmetsp:Transcript_242/g.998  ORF Transcript_242/g.998 Transcript_242/m.998 type:complete len:208 (-) Transcript_242:2020-2643(-)
MYPTVCARSTGGINTTFLERRSRSTIASRYLSSREGPTMARTNGGDESADPAPTASIASIAHNTSLTGLNPAGRRKTGIEVGTPHASWSGNGGGGEGASSATSKPSSSKPSSSKPTKGTPSTEGTSFTSSGNDTPCGTTAVLPSEGRDPGGAAAIIDAEKETTLSTACALRVSTSALSPASTLTSVPPSTNTVGTKSAPRRCLISAS